MQPSTAEIPISKAEFARRRGVSKPRVSQWIDERKIDGLALAGEGRSAKIRESIAVEQLKERLNIDQRFGNGLSTNLEAPLAPQAPAQPAAAPPLPLDRKPAVEAPVISPVDSIEKQIAAARLEQIQRANREGAEKEAARAGILTDTEAAAQQMGKIAAQIVSIYDGAIPEIATAIAAKWPIPQRDLVHLIRAEVRKVRATAAAALKRAAADIPERLPFDLGDTQEETGEA